MTVTTHALTVRPITGPEELDLFNRLPYAQNSEIGADLAEGRRHPSWMWVALDGDRLLARLSWWCRNSDVAPLLLDVLDVDGAADDVDRVEVAEHLLRTASAATLPDGGTPPEYLRFVPADWQRDPRDRRAVEERMAAVERNGGSLLVERLRFEWTPGGTAPRPGDRLRFRPIRDEEEVLGLMVRALEGTLDAHDRVDLEHRTADEVAAENYADEFEQYTTPREWWRIATLPDGGPVGFVLPARNDYHPMIGYIAVLPEHRGNGYIDDILAEGTRVLAEEGVERVRAATDKGNMPMARAFQRAGYATLSGIVNMDWKK
ncbi:GNAT family N-acetyltransferase [Nocardiopsis quinghaiensis]|uniref:GNAT family N-acetyltransferase n=1 Tax=Nocardiopsis quinghaiensis TaxID=464995 RepID=UPI00123B3786|nr:GNAT family N-acetyltransferase [Nocardiopsis quinghaiensis]